MPQANQKTIATILSEVSYEVYAKSAPAADDRPNLTMFRQMGNDAYEEVISSWDWVWMFREATFNTVVGQTTSYAVSADATEITNMQIPSNQQKLQYLPYRDWILNYPGQYTNLGNSKPTFYVDAPPITATDNGPRIYLGPAPADQIYTIKYGYRVLATPFTYSGTEYPVIPARCQDLLKYKWLMKVYTFFGPGAADKLAMATAAYQQLWTREWQRDQTTVDGVAIYRDAWTEAAYSSQADINRVLFVQR